MFDRLITSVARSIYSRIHNTLTPHPDHLSNMTEGVRYTSIGSKELLNRVYRKGKRGSPLLFDVLIRAEEEQVDKGGRSHGSDAEP